MPKATLRRPSDEIVEAALAPTTATDARGRKFVLRKPPMSMQYRLVELIGGDAAKNEVYMGMILPILWIAQIDDDTIFPPRTKSELEALIDRVDDDGMLAIAQALAGPSQTIEEHEGALKNA